LLLWGAREGLGVNDSQRLANSVPGVIGKGLTDRRIGGKAKTQARVGE